LIKNMDNKFIKTTIIEVKSGKLYEKKEINTVKIKEEINLLKAEKIRRINETTAEMDVKINELQKILNNLL